MPNDSRLVVQNVSSKNDWRHFFDLRKEIYRDDPNAVFPLRFMERSMLDPKKHPFYLHATHQAFVAIRNGMPVGRIVAIKDHLHNEHYQDKVGFFGFFECINDPSVAATLVDRASEWLADQGCEQIRGPVNPSMKSDFGVLVKGNDDPPFVMMGYTPRYYEDLLLQNSFSVIREFIAYLYDVPSTYDEAISKEPELLDATRRILKRYPSLRLENATKENFMDTFLEINRIGNSIRSSGWGFVPLTNEELVYMVSQLKRIIDPRKVLTAYWDDKLVGYCVNIPCINWALRKCVGKSDWVRLPQFLYWLRRTERTRVIALGADEDYRRKGVGMLLSTEMRTRGLRSYNYKQWEFSWVDSENTASQKAITRTMPVAQEYKRLRLYQRDL